MQIKKRVNTWEANFIICTCVIEVREKGEVQRLKKIEGDMLDRWTVRAILGVEM